MRLESRDAGIAWRAAAADYLSRGNREVAGLLETADGVTVTDHGSAAGPEWRFTDAAGDALDRSRWVVHAVAHRDPVEIQLRRGDQVLAAGTTDVRRSAAATIRMALASAGPLIEMAAIGSAPPAPAPPREPPPGPGPRVAALRAQASLAGRIARAAFTYRQWGVARLPAHSVDSVLAGDALSGVVQWNSPPPARFWADPTVVMHEEQCWVFVEELDRSTGRGHVRALRWTGESLHPGPVVWATEHHLSFPQVQLVGDRWLATVETCASANPVLTFDRLGEPWRVAPDVPVLPPHMADPVLVFDADGTPRRLFATDATTAPDTNYVEHEFRDGHWVRDPAATFVDVTTARGGGTRDPRLGVRAVQDCAGTYGRRLALVPAVGWVGTTQAAVPAELSAARAPTGDWRPAGVHTLTWTSDQEHVWIDGWRRRVSAIGGYRRVIERRHMQQCEG